MECVTITGYGVNLEQLNIDVKHFVAYMSRYDKMKSMVQVLSNHTSSITDLYDGFDEFQYDWLQGICSVVAKIISATTGINVIGVRSGDGEEYVVFPKKFPWEITRKEASLNLGDLNAILIKHFMLFSDIKASDLGVYDIEIY